MPRHEGSDKPRCGAKKSNGSLCMNFPMEFTTRCRLHGGKSPRAQKKAEETRIEFRIGKAAQQLGIAPAVDNPLVELKKLAGEVVQWKNLCRQSLDDLKDVGYAGVTGEQVHARIQVWERSLDRSITALATLAKLNIDERLAAIEEQQARLVRQAFAAACERLGIDPEARADAATEFARQLRVIEAAA